MADRPRLPNDPASRAQKRACAGDGSYTILQETQKVFKQKSAILRSRFLTALENGDLSAFEVITIEAQTLANQGYLNEYVSNDLVFRLIDFEAKLPAVDTAEWHSMLKLVSDSGMGGIAKLLFRGASWVSLCRMYLSVPELT